MKNLELSLLLLFCKNKTYLLKYTKYLKDLPLSDELRKILNTIYKYYSRFEEHTYISIKELSTYFDSEYPVLKNKDLYTKIFTELASLDISESLASEIMRRMLAKRAANEIVTHLLPVLDGEQCERVTEVSQFVADYSADVLSQDKEESPFIEDNLEQLFASEIMVPGLEWRLSCLNESIGHLRRGTLGHVFARPESGKTTFLCSELTHMASQMGESEVILGIWNEDKGKRIKTRLYESMLGLGEGDIEQRIKSGEVGELEKTFQKHGGKYIRTRYNPAATIEEIQSYLDVYNVRLLVVDIADHVRFRDAPDKKVDFLEELYRRFRVIAGTYNCDVITCGQADVACAGRKVLHLENMNNSKVGKQGALDYAIGIGASYDPAEQDLRWINIVKNKLNSEGGSGPFTVRIDKSTGRYYDF